MPVVVAVSLVRLTVLAVLVVAETHKAQAALKQAQRILVAVLAVVQPFQRLADQV
jgi:hypothetical protein